MFRLTSYLAVVVVFGVGLLAVTAQAVTTPAVVIETVPVGNPDNAYDPETGFGSVADPYLIGKYEVTAGQYTSFLNAVADTDTYGLYNEEMWSSDRGCKIERSGSSGSYTYSVAADRENRPVNYVSWYDTLRFANWLHNGQPTGQQSTSTTEDGAYTLTSLDSVAIGDHPIHGANGRNARAQVWLPSEDEWYKAAYYKGGGTNAGYWDYPNQSNTVPTAELPPGTDMTNGSANYAPSRGAYLDTYYYTTEVGAYDATDAQGEYVSDSAYGTFDQCGNLWELNEAILPGSVRGSRGGSLFDAVSALDDFHASTRSYAGPSSENPRNGFRVAVPEPSTLVLLSMGAVGLLVYGWRRRRCR